MAEEFSIIDSHAHLDYPQFEGQMDEVLARAEDLGVTQVISIGVKLSTADNRVSLPKPMRMSGSVLVSILMRRPMSRMPAIWTPYLP